MFTQVGTYLYFYFTSLAQGFGLDSRNSFSMMCPGSASVWSSAEKLALGTATFSGYSLSRSSRRHLSMKEFRKIGGDTSLISFD